LYTLQKSDGSPRRRVVYHLPFSLPACHFLGSPSFGGATVRPDLMPSFVPSLESQILVLEVTSCERRVFFVIDMVIFLERAISPGSPVEIPWSDWGPQYTCCFPTERSHPISVFGSKLACAIPLDHTPEPGQRPEENPLSSQKHVYVHIWDFNKRIIARAQSTCDRSSQNPLIRVPGRLTQSCFDGDIISNHPYTAAVCHTPFPSEHFGGLFFEHDRFTLNWVGLFFGCEYSHAYVFTL
jgi:hypothetical protein